MKDFNAAARSTSPDVTDPAVVETLVRGGMSRRDALKMFALGGAAFAATGGFPRASFAQGNATPKQGGKIRVATHSTSTKDTMDPAKLSLSSDYIRGHMFYNGLTVIDANMKAQPELAESWESTDGATKWAFKLRKGVAFHDGKPLHADDVVYSLTRHWDAATGSSVKALAGMMTEVKADGADTVRITLASGNADLPIMLGTFHFVIIKKDTKDFATAVGTGPYVVKEFAPGIRTVGTRNANYWKPGKPYLDEIELIGIPDDNARVNALLSGDVQLITQLNARLVPQVESASNAKVFETKAGMFTGLVIMQDRTPSNSPGLALAMKHLIDREQMIKTVLRGYGTIANDHPIPPSNPYYCPDIPQHTLDIDKAKSLIAKAGLAGSKVQMYASTAALGSIDMAVMIQRNAQKAGLEIDVVRQPADGYWANTWMKQPLHFSNLHGRPTADIAFSLLFKSDAEWNECRWKNPRFDELLLKARGESDDTKRRDMYWEMQHLVHDHAGRMIPAFPSLLDAHAGNLQGMQAIPTGGLSGYRFAENVWLA
jgi:peptide/nickel transport system substrate-binding protein